MNLSRRAFLFTTTAAIGLFARQANGQTVTRSSPDLQAVPRISVHDCQRKPGSSGVLVPLRRESPSYWSPCLEVRLSTIQAYPDIDLAATVIFPWDVDEVLVPFDLPEEFADGTILRITVDEAWRNYGETRVEFLAPEARVTGAAPAALAPVARSVTHGFYPRIVRPADYRKTFWSDLGADFEATDTGYRADGTPCWQSRLEASRLQSNGEISIATDPVLHAGHDITPWYLDNGVRVLQAEKMDKPIAYGGKDTIWSGPTITTRTLHRTGYGWIEARIAMDGAHGSWPAFWMKPGGTWPPEEDIMEWTFAEPQILDTRPFFTQWWLTEGDGDPISRKAMAGAALPIFDLLPGFDPREPHVYALHWQEDVQEWFIDGQLVFSQPNRNILGDMAPAERGGRMYLKLNLVVGGLAGDPDESHFPSRMRVWHVGTWEP